jgi:hypothetical protein
VGSWRPRGVGYCWVPRWGLVVNECSLVRMRLPSMASWWRMQHGAQVTLWHDEVRGGGSRCRWREARRPQQQREFRRGDRQHRRRNSRQHRRRRGPVQLPCGHRATRPRGFLHVGGADGNAGISGLHGGGRRGTAGEMPAEDGEGLGADAF